MDRKEIHRVVQLHRQEFGAVERAQSPGVDQGIETRSGEEELVQFRREGKCYLAGLQPQWVGSDDRLQGLRQLDKATDAR